MLQRPIYRIQYKGEEIFVYFNRALNAVELHAFKRFLEEDMRGDKGICEVLQRLLNSSDFRYLQGEIGGSPFAGEIKL